MMDRKPSTIPIKAFVSALLLLPLLLAACGGESATPTTTEPGFTSGLMLMPTSMPAAGGSTGMSAATSTTAAAAATATTGSAAMELNVAPLASGDVPVDAAKAPESSAAGETDLTRSGTYNTQPYKPSLTAGEIDDNASFVAYLQYLNSYQGGAVSKLDVSERLYVQVAGADQKPVAGALVHIYAGQEEVFAGRTTADGRVLFFPRLAKAAGSYRVLAEAGGASVEGMMARGSEGAQLKLDAVSGANAPVTLDIVFLLDATGSMADEIAKLQATIGSISSRLEQLPGGTTARFGLVAYRDRGEEYVTRSWDLTASVEQFSANLAQVEASAGGDTYEDVNAGLHEALALPGWQSSQETRHLRLLFLVGDAAPHLDYANGYAYTDLLQTAVANGVKIFPIGCSGLDDMGEYVFRQFAQVTGGKFVFLTYENGVSGAPGVATTNHVEQFSVSNLDDLLVNLIAKEVAFQNVTAAAALPALVPVENPVRIVEPIVAPVRTLADQLSPMVDAVQSWGWIVLVLAAMALWLRERQKVRVVNAAIVQQAAPGNALVQQAAPVDEEATLPTGYEFTRTLNQPVKVRVRGSRVRRQSALSHPAPVARSGYVSRNNSYTQPLPPREGE